MKLSCAAIVVGMNPVGDTYSSAGQQRALAGKCEYGLRYQDGWRML